VLIGGLLPDSTTFPINSIALDQTIRFIYLVADCTNWLLLFVKSDKVACLVFDERKSLFDQNVPKSRGPARRPYGMRNKRPTADRPMGRTEYLSEFGTGLGSLIRAKSTDKPHGFQGYVGQRSLLALHVTNFATFLI